LLQHAVLDGGEELFGFLKRQTEMLKACGILLHGDEVCHCFFTSIIAAHNELQFDTHGESSSGSGGRRIMQVILPEFVDYPQHLHALLSQLILFGERALRHALTEYVAHYHEERPHQGKGNVVLMPSPRHRTEREGPIRRRERLGGLLKYYNREAA
jgi:hypothetical protein